MQFQCYVGCNHQNHSFLSRNLYNPRSSTFIVVVIVGSFLTLVGRCFFLHTGSRFDNLRSLRRFRLGRGRLDTIKTDGVPREVRFVFEVPSRTDGVDLPFTHRADVRAKFGIHFRILTLLGTRRHLLIVVIVIEGKVIVLQ